MAPEKEHKLAPLFPWEEREHPKPTRVFVEDEQLPPPPVLEPEPEPEPEEVVAGADELEVQADADSPDISAAHSNSIVRESPWELFDARTKNAVRQSMPKCCLSVQSSTCTPYNLCLRHMLIFLFQTSSGTMSPPSRLMFVR